MKVVIQNLFATICLSLLHAISFGQQSLSDTDRLEMAAIAPYDMEVTYNKTSHLIFPSNIRYADLGSEYLIASKADGAGNVLRVKAAVKDFQDETNFSVVTEDGRFYSFNVFYSAYPESSSYDLKSMQKILDRKTCNDVLFEELGSEAPSLVDLIMESICNGHQRPIKHIGAKSYGIRFLLKGLYVQNGKYYFHTEIRNKSNISFKVDFITFKVLDKDMAKRMVSQEHVLQPLRSYHPPDEVAANTSEENVFLLDQFTLADDKVVVIDLFEKNGGRQLELRIENTDLIHANLINDMHLKIK